jgi:hypothetical protein
VRNLFLLCEKHDLNDYHDLPAMYTKVSTSEKNLTIGQAAEIAGLTYEGIRSAIMSGRLPAIKRIGRYEIRPDDLAKFCEPVVVGGGANK